MRRIYEPILREHVQKYQQMTFLVGPRQVGKTTLSLTTKNFSDLVIYYNWDILDHRQLIIGGPNRIANNAGLDELRETKPVIIFDEIHKYKNWKIFLKGFYDHYKDRCHIVVTGSSKLDVYTRGGDSLMGRYFPYRIHPFTVAECVRTIVLEQPISPPQQISDEDFDALWRFGGFPDPFLQRNERFYNKWKKLRQHQLFHEDIRDLSHIQEIDQIEILALILKNQSGQLLNYSNLATKITTSVTTVKRWVKTLQSFYYCFLIKPWTKNITRSLLKEPKLYLWDWAEITNDEGAKFETFVASHLFKAIHFWNDVGFGNYGLYFIRDKEKREVDFLVTQDEKPWLLIEAKHSANHSINQNLYRFQEQTKAQHAFQVVLDKDYVAKNCFDYQTPIIVPAKTFLSQLI